MPTDPTRREKLVEPERSHYLVDLSKQDFKFSSGHFTIFGPDEAELLHGHNYRVRVELEGRILDEVEMLVSFRGIKREIRSLCEWLDTRTLMPEHSPLLSIEPLDGHTEFRFNERRYVIPDEDVLILPLINITVEALARYLWQLLLNRIDLIGLERMSVLVEETDGQGCWFRADIPQSHRVERTAT